MTNYGLKGTTASNLSTNVADILITPRNTDAGNGQTEYEYQCLNWAKYWGYFNDIPELNSALTMKAIWDVGKGYTTDTATKVTLEHIRGWGKDTFTDILFNMDLISRLAGDAYAEIIKDEKTGLLLNLKVLDPGSIKIIVDNKGMLKRYEQVNKNKETVHRFKPEQIFHLSHKRLADQIHGISVIDSMNETILAELENFKDLKKIMHRQARPMIMFKVNTDDPTVINDFVTKMDAACNKGENIYIPADANTVSYEVIQVNIGQYVMQWRDDIRNKFYRTLGLPLIVFGSAGSTESGGKIEYLAHEQVFSHDQRFIEEQIWRQLYIKIKLNSPVTLLDNLQTDQAKDANQGLEIQPQDVTPGSGD